MCIWPNGLSKSLPGFSPGCVCGDLSSFSETHVSCWVGLFPRQLTPTPYYIIQACLWKKRLRHNRNVNCLYPRNLWLWRCGPRLIFRMYGGMRLWYTNPHKHTHIHALTRQKQNTCHLVSQNTWDGRDPTEGSLVSSQKLVVDLWVFILLQQQWQKKRHALNFS